LILGNQGRRLPQLGTFLKLLTDNVPVEAAFQKAFQSTFEQMEKELKDYLKNDRYPVMTGHFEQKLALDKEMQSAPVSEAEAQAYLGDLLLHSRRKEAENYLQKALELDPGQPLAHASLGMLRVYEGRFGDALRSLERSLAANSRNYLTQYYYALALSRQGMDANNYVSDYSAESAEKMRTALRKAIELEPTFPESYSLLAFINMVKGEQLDESIALIRKALAASPGKEEYSLTLAQLYLQKQDFKAARLALEPLARNGTDAEVRRHAQSLLDQVTSFEKRMSEFKEETREAPPRLARKESTAEDSQEVSLDPLSYLGEALRKPAAGEVRAQGALVRIDCGAKAIVFTIKTGDRLLKVETTSFEKMDFRTFTETVSGEITCGIRKKEDAVVVTYKLISVPRAKTDGTAISLEFVPKEFKLKL
jgi:tetratricopeptide (TPR) repeat protein